MMVERLAAEQHDTLADIPEPSENPALFGHETEQASLAAAYASARLHHGLIFSGPQGIGKATLAFRFARHILAHPDPAGAPPAIGDADPASSLFRMIANGGHPSVLYLTRPLNDRTKAFKSAVTVDEIRKVSRFLSMTAHDGGYRIVIVDPADDMNASAANALLKSLEEPPARTLFILISHAAGGLLPTIRSRCQTVRFQPLGDEALSQTLSHLGLPVPAQTLPQLIERASGSAREAILLTQYGGLEIAIEIERLAGEKQFDTAGAWRLADAVSGRDQAMQFAIFNRRALDMVGARATAVAGEGRLAEAEALASLWQEIERTIAETETYNLDKRQHVFGLMRRLHEALAA
ncbi:DNA polymerase III subunit delta' [Mesorhizobium xinjiangense]|uniref:DNA polymerase III subunit delta' n=1 Tax=Mesorhizobium xinjiangense TaxID=2678685 RepID=UPI0012ED2F63|nr:DNA polymerase III subunit delta' [Mesorhizobium xinjiangense]